MVSIWLGLLAAFSLLVFAANCLMSYRVKMPDPPGADHISEGPYSKASRQRAAYRSRAIWALGLGLALLASMIVVRSALPATAIQCLPGSHRSRTC
jgi:hypothetical protein